MYKLTPKIVEHVLGFIHARQFRDMRESKRHQVWLKRRLKRAFVAVLLTHGDPDRDGYMTVMSKWVEFERQLLNQGASGR